MTPATPLPPLSQEQFQKKTGLPAALQDDLSSYVDLLEKWQKRINLVSKSTLADVWRRHVWDSLQIYPLIPKETKTVIDLGSGAGFPGLVLALFSKAYNGPEIHLIEADSRKTAFLEEVNRETSAGAIIHTRRLESVRDLKADVVTARALAPLPKLLTMATPFGAKDCRFLFFKGEKVQAELTEAAKKWTMEVVETPSVSHQSGTILTLKGVKHRE